MHDISLMNGKFFKNIIFLLFVNLLVKPFWILGVDRAVQNSVGDASYGSYLALYNFAYLFYIVLDIGLTNFNSRSIAQNPSLLSRYFVGISEAKILLSIVYFVIIFAVGYSIGYRGEQLSLLAVVGFNQVLLSLILYVRSNVSALLMFKTDSLLSILDRVLMILICGFLLWSGVLPSGSFNIWIFVYSQTISYVLTLVVALIVVLRHTGKLVFTFDIPLIIKVIRESLPYALLVLLMSFYSRLEPVLIERLLPKDIAAEQTGIYARAYRLFDAGNNISYLFSVILLPLFASMIQKKESLQEVVSQSFGLMITMTGTVAILGIFFSSEVLSMMYSQGHSREAALILCILMGSFVSISITYIFGTLLTANGNLRQLNIVSAVGVGVNVVLNVIFIPRFMAVGAAFTSLCVQFAVCLCEFIIAQKIMNFKIKLSFWIKMIIFIVISIMIVWVVKSLIHNIFASMGVSAVACFILALITRMVDVKEFISLIQMSKNLVSKK